jgi:IS605 OrfB family transposase
MQMSKLTYNTKLIFKTDEDKNNIFKMLESQLFAWNECSKIQFTLPKNSIVDLHSKYYKLFRENNPTIPSQVVISAEQSVLSTFRTIQSNKQKIKSSPVKRHLSIRLDKRTYSYKNGIFSLISLEKRVKCQPYVFPRLQELISKYVFCDPLLFVRNNEIYIALTFTIPDIKPQNKLVIGVDLGCVNLAATSEGKLYKCPSFNARKRQLRHLKSSLKSKSTKSARKHLNKLRHKEHNINKNLSHNLANRIIQDTTADVIVLENLKSLKVKKHKYQNKNRISQIPMFELRRIITYKALLHNKQVITVSPAYTSQIDHRTGKLDGKRIGGRYIGKDNQILHADVNAACNIGLRSKLPCSISNYYVWQAKVNSPIVFKSSKSLGVLQAPTASA